MKIAFVFLFNIIIAYIGAVRGRPVTWKEQAAWVGGAFTASYIAIELAII